MTKPPSLSRADRAILRRLRDKGSIDHRWGDKWNLDAARAVLNDHKLKLQQKKAATNGEQRNPAEAPEGG